MSARLVRCAGAPVQAVRRRSRELTSHMHTAAAVMTWMRPPPPAPPPPSPFVLAFTAHRAPRFSVSVECTS